MPKAHPRRTQGGAAPYGCQASSPLTCTHARPQWGASMYRSAYACNKGVSTSGTPRKAYLLCFTWEIHLSCCGPNAARHSLMRDRVMAPWQGGSVKATQTGAGPVGPFTPGREAGLELYGLWPPPPHVPAFPLSKAARDRRGSGSWAMCQNQSPSPSSSRIHSDRLAARLERHRLLPLCSTGGSTIPFIVLLATTPCRPCLPLDTCFALNRPLALRLFLRQPSHRSYQQSVHEMSKISTPHPHAETVVPSSVADTDGRKCLKRRKWTGVIEIETMFLQRVACWCKRGCWSLVPIPRVV